MIMVSCTPTVRHLNPHLNQPRLADNSVLCFGRRAHSRPCKLCSSVTIMLSDFLLSSLAGFWETLLAFSGRSAPATESFTIICVKDVLPGIVNAGG